MVYNCEICKYETLHKSNFNKHSKTIKHCKKLEEKNKDDIEKIESNICYICTKKLSSKQSYNSHIVKCRGLSSSLECSKCKINFNNRVSRYKHEQKCCLINPKNISITNINNTTNNIINNNIVNITVNKIGNEKLDHFIEHPDFINFMYNCIENKIDGICNLIAKKHFDPEHPENHNIRKLNKKDNFIEIYDNNSWNIKNYKDGIYHFTISLEETFSTFMEKLTNENIEIKYDVIQHFMKEIGSILEWDLSTGNYDFSYNNINMKKKKMSDKETKMLLIKIYKLFCECLFKYSKIIHKSKNYTDRKEK